MNVISRCKHCFQEEKDGPLPRITGPAKTSIRHVCRFCGAAVYLAYTFGEAGGPVKETPPTGHVFTRSVPAGECDLCQGRSPSEPGRE